MVTHWSFCGFNTLNSSGITLVESFQTVRNPMCRKFDDDGIHKEFGKSENDEIWEKLEMQKSETGGLMQVLKLAKKLITARLEGWQDKAGRESSGQ